MQKIVRFSLLFWLLLAPLQAAPTLGDRSGEEMLVYQGEFRAAQDREREAHKEMRGDLALAWNRIYEIEKQQARSDDFHKRMDEKFSTQTYVIWTLTSLLLMQAVIPLIKMLLRREISRAAGKGLEL